MSIVYHAEDAFAHRRARAAKAAESDFWAVLDHEKIPERDRVHLIDLAQEYGVATVRSVMRNHYGV